jgi:hypothetical protein
MDDNKNEQQWVYNELNNPNWGLSAILTNFPFKGGFANNLKQGILIFIYT